MKRTLLTIIAALFLGGVVKAQQPTWPTANLDAHNWSSNTPIVAAVSIDGVAQTDLTSLTLGAFAVDEQQRGLATVANNSTFNNQFWIQVFYNYNTTEAISFKLYDADNQTEYTTCTVTPPTTTQDEGWGTPGNPVELNFTNTPETETQTIALAAGTNWVSFRVETDLDALKDALVEATSSATGTKIVSQDASTTWYGTRWRGDLNALDVAKSFRITVPVACEIELDGAPINPTDHPITIKKGANWIGYPLAVSMEPAIVFSGFAASGDKVSSQTESSTWYGTRWRGDLTTIVPGKGYIYKSTVDNDRTFVFPSSTNKK